jgi:hypothetical protein
MTITTYKGFKITLNEVNAAARQFTYQIDDEKIVDVDCPDIADLDRIVKRVIDARLDPHNIGTKLEFKPTKGKGTIVPTRGVTPDGKPSELVEEE